MKAPVSESGFTLIESIFTIVIIAIAMTGLVAVWSNAVSHSADPLWQSQTNALGKLYIAEIHATDFAKLSDYQGEIKTLSGQEIQGYPGFRVKIQVSPAGKTFDISSGNLKKVLIVINNSFGKSQQFVTFRGNY